jgi:AhpD family alkylhydroperoxidase
MIMPLVPMLDSSEFAEVDQDLLVAAEKASGQMLNAWAAIGNSPGLFAAYLPFLRQINGPERLETRIKELIAIRVAVLNHCRYTASHRCRAAAANGATEQELGAVAGGDFSGFTERERLALQLTDEMTTELPTRRREQSRTGVSEHLHDSAMKLFDPAELVELTMSIGVWNAMTRFHRVLDLDLDMPEAPPAVESAL